jgi:hypothetical protein
MIPKQHGRVLLFFCAISEHIPKIDIANLLDCVAEMLPQDFENLSAESRII